MAAKRAGSNTGLIVTLVIFILLALILGVTTYMGFSGQTKLEADLKTKENDRQAYENESDWNRFQALLYRADLGADLTEKEWGALGTLRERFDRNDGKLAPRERGDKDVADKLIRENLDKTFRWDTVAKKPGDGATAFAQLKALSDQLGASKTAADGLKSQLQAEQAKTAKLNKDLAKEKEDNANALKALKDEFSAKLEDNRKQLEGLQTANKAQGEKIASLEGDNATSEKKHAIEISKKDKEIKELKQQIAKLEEAAQDQKIASSQSAGTFTRLETDKPRGEIVVIKGDGMSPFINLGSADHVRTGLRFTVHGKDQNGRANLEAKATLEVIEIISDHQSRARLIKVVDAKNDPVLVGDQLFNPAWDPNRKKHVALAGVIDLSGNQRDGLLEFIRDLSRQNLEVDAYLDLKDGEVKGEITRQTDFLILGDLVQDSKLHLPKDKVTDMDKKISAMQDTAVRNGVKVVNLRDFLSMTASAPPSAPSEKDKYKFGTTLPAVGSPVYRK
jgi:hypothetical protein